MLSKRLCIYRGLKYAIIAIVPSSGVSAALLLGYDIHTGPSHREPGHTRGQQRSVYRSHIHQHHDSAHSSLSN